MEENLNISPDLLSKILTDEQGQAPTTKEIADTESALNSFAHAQSVHLNDSIKERIKAKMAKLNFQSKNRSPFTLKNLPLLTPDANLLDWEEALAKFETPIEFGHDGIHMIVLESNDTRDLMLGWSKEIIPEEVHDDLIESFIVLDGSCECHIWRDDDPNFNKKVHMQTGDFLQLNLGESHDIITTSAVPVKAVLQRLKVRA